MNFDANGNAIAEADPTTAQALSLGSVSDAIGSLLTNTLSVYSQVEDIKAARQQNRLTQAQQTQANSVAAAAAANSASAASQGVPKWVVWGAVGLAAVGLGWMMFRKS